MIDISKHYGTLTAPERLKLSIEAMARGDWDEAGKLGGSCPKIAYQPQRDMAFTGKYQSLQVMALLHAVNFYQLTCEMRHSELIATVEAWQRFCEYAGFDPETTLKAFGLKLETSWLDDLPPGDGPNEDLTEDIYQGHLRYWA